MCFLLKKSHGNIKRRRRGKRGSLISLSCPHGSCYRSYIYVGNVFLTCPTIHRYQTPFTYLFTLYYADIKNLMKSAILINVRVNLNSNTFFKCLPVADFLDIMCISLYFASYIFQKKLNFLYLLQKINFNKHSISIVIKFL